MSYPLDPSHLSHFLSSGLHSDEESDTRNIKPETPSTDTATRSRYPFSQLESNIELYYSSMALSNFQGALN